MKHKKLLSILLSVLLVFVCAAGCAGGKKRGIIDDANTLNIKVYKSGFGDLYVSAWIDEFQKMYSTEGYKVNVVESNRDILGANVTNELITGDKNKIDFYIAGNVSPSVVYEASTGLGREMDAKNLNSLFSLNPIGQNKQEESISIEQKLQSGFSDFYKLDGDYYALPYRSAPVSLVINPTAFARFSNDMDYYPRTTNELIKITDAIRAKRATTGIYPFAYALKDAHSYVHSLEDVWATQYMGLESYLNYCSLNSLTPQSTPQEAANVVAGGRVAIAREKSIDTLAKIQTFANLADSVSNHDIGRAQGDLIDGKAVFMATGSWLQNESIAYYPEVVNMEMVSIPVLSEVGVDLKLDGNNGSDTEKCDKVLSLMIKCIDENKSFDLTKTEVMSTYSVQITEAQFTAVAQARGVFYDWGIPTQIVVNKHTTKYEIVELFLRFIVSDYAIKLAFESSTMNMPYKTTNADNSATIANSKFLTSVDNMMKRDQSSFIYRQATGLRDAVGINFYIKESNKDIQLSMLSKQINGATVIAEEREEMMKKWQGLFSN